jgi:chemotaxis signal transduction protein
MTATENAGSNSYVLLQVGERRFAMRADIVEELAPPVRLHSFPHTSPLIVGVIVRRGHVVPVYDVGPVLFGKASPAHRFYLVARRQFGETIESSAIPVNGECELTTGEVEPAREGRPEYVTGILTTADEKLEILNFEALMAAPAAAARESSQPSGLTEASL